MTKVIRWAILGCGKIARKMATDLKHVAGAELVAVAARELSSAQEFAADFPAKHVHGSYLELVQNPEVDVIYVATPHALHYEHVILCLRHGKAVLCEKAFAINLRQAKEMVSIARAQKLFMMEAFWTRFLPHYQKMKQLIQEGAIGDIQFLRAEIGFIPVHPVAPRMFEPTLGGGSLLDIGIYPVFMTLNLMGKPDKIEAVMTPANTGIDLQCAIQFQYANGAMAQLFSTFASQLATAADIAGNRGRFRIQNRFHGPTAELEYFSGAVDTRELIGTEKAKGFGYEYEARHVTDCLQKGLTESPVLPLSETLLLMEVLDTIREKSGIRYPVD